MRVYTYNTEKYNFAQLVADHFGCDDLRYLHKVHPEWLSKEKLDFSTESSTPFHDSFYAKLNSPWEEFITKYKEIVRMLINILPDEKYIFQYLPSFRVHLPGQRVIHKTHYDSDADHMHPVGEINIFLPLTDCLETNTIWTESEPGKRDFSPILMDYGDLAIWNGNKCAHYNKDNKEEKCRVSLDFRVLSKKIYNPATALNSATSGKRFIIGEYYEEL